MALLHPKEEDCALYGALQPVSKRDQLVLNVCQIAPMSGAASLCRSVSTALWCHNLFWSVSCQWYESSPMGKRMSLPRPTERGLHVIQHPSARLDTRASESNKCASGRVCKSTVETKVTARISSPADNFCARLEFEHTLLDPSDSELCLRKVSSGEISMEALSNTDVQMCSRIWPDAPE